MFVQFINFIFILLHSTCAQEEKSKKYDIIEKFIYALCIQFCKTNIGTCKYLIVVKGVSSKPSRKCIVVPNFCFLSQRLQILATCLFLNFLLLCKVSERLDKLDIIHFIRVPPLMFFVFVIYQKFKGGDPYKMSNINVVQSC